VQYVKKNILIYLYILFFTGSSNLLHTYYYLLHEKNSNGSKLRLSSDSTYHKSHFVLTI